MGKRIIYVREDIQGDNLYGICDALWEAVDNPEISQIVLYICSGGGGTRIIPTITEYIKIALNKGKEVFSIGTGIVASTASVIFLLAPNRILLPNTQFVVHQSFLTLDGMFGTEKLEKLVFTSQHSTKMVFESLLANSNIPREVLLEKTRGNNDWFFTDEELKEYGIVTQPFDSNELARLLSMC